MNNRTELNKHIYAGAKLVCEKIGIPSKRTQKQVITRMVNSIGNADKKSTKTGQNDKTKERRRNMWEQKGKGHTRKITVPLEEIKQKALDHIDPKGPKQRNYSKQLQTHNLPTNYEENINSTNKGSDLLLANNSQIIPWRTERMPQRIQRHSRVTLHRSTHPKWEQDQTEKCSYGMDR